MVLSSGEITHLAQLRVVLPHETFLHLALVRQLLRLRMAVKSAGMRRV